MSLKLKDVYWAREGEDLFLYTPAAEEITLADPSHQVQRLLTAIREGAESLTDLAATLSLPVSEVADAVEALDDLGLVTAADAGSMSAMQRVRYRSNLALCEACGSLGRAPAAFQEVLTEAHVVRLVLAESGPRSSRPCAEPGSAGSPCSTSTGWNARTWPGSSCIAKRTLATSGGMDTRL